MGLMMTDKERMVRLFGKKVKTVRLLFSSVKDGWRVKDWREKCMGKA